MGNPEPFQGRQRLIAHQNRYLILLFQIDQMTSDLLQFHGGTLVAAFKSAFADENVKVSHTVQPRILKDCLCR